MFAAALEPLLVRQALSIAGTADSLSTVREATAAPQHL